MRLRITKTVLFFLIIIILNYSCIGSLNAASPEVNININGQRIYPDTPAFIKNERTMVPLRGVFEKLGAEVGWDADNRIVNIVYKDKTISLQINNKQALIDGRPEYMDVEPLIYNDRTMIPLRFISENIGMNVNWLPEASLATITEPSYLSSASYDTVLGFTAKNYYGDNASNQSVTAFSNILGSIATFSYCANYDGSLQPTGVSQLDTVKLANSKGIKPLLLVHNFKNGGFDRNLAHSVLADPSARKNFIGNILIQMGKEEYSGVNIDLENIYWYDRQSLSDFVRELKETLSPFGFQTTICVPAKTYDNKTGDNWSGAFDYYEIGKYADQIVVMTYDEHYFGGPAGPIASISWVENVIRYAASVIPSGKILMGIAAYGYDWASSGTKAVTYKNIESIIASGNSIEGWDEVYRSPYLKYTKDGVDHVVWYENGASLAGKLAIAKKYNLGGFGIWRLGFEDGNFWDALK